MNEETDNQTPVTPSFEDEPMKMPENSNSPQIEVVTEPSVVNGPLLIIMTVLLIVILGGMYYWFSTLSTTSTTTPEVPAETVVERPTAIENNEPESTTAEAQTEALLTTSTSDELDAIVADVEVGLGELDAELEAIEAELEADLQ